MRRIARTLARSLAVTLAIALAGCAPQSVAIRPSPTAARSPAAEQSDIEAAGPTVRTIRAPGAATDVRLAPAGSAVEIYRSIAPSIAFVDTPTGTGSGLLVDPGYVLTNAHVVWPFQEARVVLPDGSSWDHAPVAAADVLVDLALLGPIETSAPPVSLVGGEDLEVARTVYVVGYPGEVDRFPQPAIAAGLISRYREWQQLGITYFQVDATIAGGQSGGALLSEDGRVIGVSGFLFAGTYGLIASAEDLETYIARLIAEARDESAPVPWLPEGSGARRLTMTLANLWDTRMAVIQEPPGTTLQIEVDSANDAYIEVLDAFGESLALADDSYSGTESIEVTIESPGPHFVVLAQSDEASGRFSLRSSHAMVPYVDPYDGSPVSLGQSITGTIDYPMDTDYYSLDLQEGQIVDLLVDSTMIDPYLRVDYWGAASSDVASDDDSGGGVFGLNARLIYTAPHDDTYFVVVEDAESEFGGYVLSVREVAP